MTFQNSGWPRLGSVRLRLRRGTVRVVPVSGGSSSAFGSCKNRSEGSSLKCFRFRFRSCTTLKIALSFLSLLFCLEKGKENHPTKKDFYPCRTPKKTKRKRENSQKTRISSLGQKTRNSKKQGKEDQGGNLIIFNIRVRNRICSISEPSGNFER